MGSWPWSVQGSRFSQKPLRSNQLLSHLRCPAVPLPSPNSLHSQEVGHFPLGWWQRGGGSLQPGLAGSERWYSIHYLGCQPASSYPLARATAPPPALWNSWESSWCSSFPKNKLEISSKRPPDHPYCDLSPQVELSQSIVLLYHT